MSRRVVRIVFAFLVSLGVVLAFTLTAGAATSTAIGLNYGDPGVAHFGTTYYIYGSTQGSGFPFATAPSYAGPYTQQGAILTDPPSWIGLKPGTKSNRMWAPQVFRYRSGAANAYTYVLYYTAWSTHDERSCLGVARSDYPSFGFTPTAGPICAPDNEPSVCPSTPVNDCAEAIDPTPYKARDGVRYMIFKTSLRNTSRWKLWAMPMGYDGLAPSGAPSTLITADARMESPSLIRHKGTLWLFVSRNWYNQCAYSTQAWSASSLFSGFTYRTTILQSSSPNPCANGGASVVKTPGGTRIAFFSYAGEPKPKNRFDSVGTLAWTANTAAGVPYLG